MSGGAGGETRTLRPVRTVRRVAIELADLRGVLGQFATGVTVLTAGGENGHGMTANAFTSLSLDPPLVLCCVARAARMHAAVLATGSFGGQEEQEVHVGARSHRPAAISPGCDHGHAAVLRPRLGPEPGNDRRVGVAKKAVYRF